MALALSKNKSALNRLKIPLIRFVLYGWLVYSIIKLVPSIIPHIYCPQNSDGKTMNAGDCAAIGMRRPSWDNRDAILTEIQDFKMIYKHRPIRRNFGGMRFTHSFALWYILRSIRPTPVVVVESGAHRGHSTWIIRQALPYTKIISISPNPPQIRIENVIYYNSENFTDFSMMKWDRFRFNPEESLFFFDDHQSAYRRIFEEGANFGFKRFIEEDNFGYMKGDSVSMKWLCEVDRKHLWTGKVKDNFGKRVTSQTWNEHLVQANEVREKVKYYYEFPPLVPQNISKSERYAYDEEHAAPPLLNNIKDVLML